MAKEGDQKDLICGVTMETIDVEKEDMIRVAARAEWGLRVFCVEQGGGGGRDFCALAI